MTLTEADMLEILEEIARDGRNGAARISAIKQLREMQGRGEDETEFDDLYEDEVATRRNRRQAAA